MANSKKRAKGRSVSKPRCGLCGKTRNLIKTECRGNWICTMSANTGCSRMLGIVATGITPDTRFADIII